MWMYGEISIAMQKELLLIFSIIGFKHMCLLEVMAQRKAICKGVALPAFPKRP